MWALGVFSVKVCCGVQVGVSECIVWYTRPRSPAAIIAWSAQLYTGSSKEIFQSKEESHCDEVDSRRCWWR